MNYLPELIQLRHQLHTYPEVSGQEAETATRIKSFLQQYPPDQLIEKLGGHGLLAVYHFGEGARILLRCELDALPIQEQNDFDHKSLYEGVSHKCGHDGHMAIIAGLAPWLHSRPFDKGTVMLLFQPAEETGLGAAGVIKDPRFEEFKPDMAFALHNIPGYPRGEIIQVPGQFSATVQSNAIKLYGKQSHSAQPENGINPALAMAAINQAFDQMIQGNPEGQDFALLTPIYMTLGVKEYGISAGYGEVHYTMRTWTQVGMDALIQKMESKIQEICQEHRLQHEIDYFDYFPGSINDENCNKLLQIAANTVGHSITTRTSPFRFGEDFGWISQLCPSAMFGLGAGEDCPVLHSDTYDFPDEILPVGIEVFKGIVKEVLGSQ